MRTALWGLAGLLFLAVMGCVMLPGRSPYPYQEPRIHQPTAMESGTHIDESTAKNIKIGVHTKQNIEMWFGKPEPEHTGPIDDPNHLDPDGCVEGWMYMNMLIITPDRQGRRGNNLPQALTETLQVNFGKDGKVCRWSLIGMGQDKTTRSQESAFDRPIDESKAKNIKNGVHTKQDIEKWFGVPSSMGFGDGLSDPKGCGLELWRYLHVVTHHKNAPGQASFATDSLLVKFDKGGKVCTSSFYKMVK